MFGSEVWVPLTNCLFVWKSIGCLLSLIHKICLSFISCPSLVQYQESLELFGLLVHSSAFLPIFNSWFEQPSVSLECGLPLVIFLDPHIIESPAEIEYGEELSVMEAG